MLLIVSMATALRRNPTNTIIRVNKVVGERRQSGSLDRTIVVRFVCSQTSYQLYYDMSIMYPFHAMHNFRKHVDVGFTSSVPILSS